MYMSWNSQWLDPPSTDNDEYVAFLRSLTPDKLEIYKSLIPTRPLVGYNIDKLMVLERALEKIKMQGGRRKKSRNTRVKKVKRKTRRNK